MLWREEGDEGGGGTGGWRPHVTGRFKHFRKLGCWLHLAQAQGFATIGIGLALVRDLTCMFCWRYRWRLPWPSPGGPRGGSALTWSGVIWAARALSAREGSSGALRPDSVHDEPSAEALSPELRLRSLTLGRSRGRVLAPACRVTGAAPKGDPVVRGPRPKRSGPCPRCGLVPVLAILRLPRRSRSISDLIRFAGTQAHRAFVYVARDSDSGRACGAGPKQACSARVVCFPFPREL